jgi:hypothetical protein
MYRQKSNLQEIHEWLSVAKTLPETPQMPSPDVQKLVLSIVLEELSELAEAGGIDVLEQFTELLERKIYSLLLQISSAKKQKTIIGSSELKEGLSHYLDALVDLEWTAHNGTCFSGLTKEYSEHFEKVTKANWSKFDVNAKDAFITKQNYLDKGIDTHFEEKVLNDTTYYVTYRNDKKIMKSYRFKEPQLTLF